MTLQFTVVSKRRDEAFRHAPLPGGEEFSLSGVTVVRLAPAGVQGTHAPFGCLAGAVELTLLESGHFEEGQTYTVTIIKG